MHEVGHLLFYWAQGIPAGISLVMEFPLIDITEKQYSIGSLGGPLMSLTLFLGSWFTVKRYEKKTLEWSIFSAFIISNSYYLLFRTFLGYAKGDGGEIESAMKLFGLNYHVAAAVFILLALIVLFLWGRRFNIKFSITNVGYYFLLFVVYLLAIFSMEWIDSFYLWDRFPRIRIGEDRFHPPY